MADTSNLTNYLRDVAKAIKDKKGITEPILAANFDIEIETINVDGGLDTSDATATANDIAQYKTAYINGEKVEGTVWDGRPGAPNITGEESHIGVNLENVQYHIDEDVASFGGWLEFKGRLNTSCILDERCVLVMDEEGVHIADAIGLTGDKIIAGNTILGIEGTAEAGGGIDTSDATAIPNDILSGKTAYVNGEKIEGVAALVMTQEEYDTAMTSVNDILGPELLGYMELGFFFGPVMNIIFAEGLPLTSVAGWMETSTGQILTIGMLGIDNSTTQFLEFSTEGKVYDGEDYIVTDKGIVVKKVATSSGTRYYWSIPVESDTYSTMYLSTYNEELSETVVSMLADGITFRMG